MTAPLLDLAPPGDLRSLGVALALGVAFGWFLERGGLGCAPKLAGQFYGTDLTVLRVLLTAIVTAALGLFWLGRLGVLDLSRVYVPETWPAPQAAGGLLFGIGFVAAGLCPGTSVVAAVTGRLDGLAVMAGLLAGVLGFDEAMGLRAFAGFYRSSPRGALTLPGLAGVPPGVVVAGLVAMALAAFAIARRFEVPDRREGDRR